MEIVFASLKWLRRERQLCNALTRSVAHDTPGYACHSGQEHLGCGSCYVQSQIGRRLAVYESGSLGVAHQVFGYRWKSQGQAR